MNLLEFESSLYLKQHAQQPVHWHPYNAKAWQRAKDENKPVIVSIGYSSCHWCHVMAHECFDDFEVAEVMNRHFVSIKIDREEFPDADHFYMRALHAMGGSGGWPLNCITLSDGRPLYAATYIPKARWIDLLQQIIRITSEQPQTALQYADQIEQAMQPVSTFQSHHASITPINFKQVLKSLEPQLDFENGLLKGAPKFIMPEFWNFLLSYCNMPAMLQIQKAVSLTLFNCALKGLYDPINGGFYRYATDEKLKIPHFEKMLYDQAQLISLYWDAYALFKEPFYRYVAVQVIEFIESQMGLPEFGFSAALDADSPEGEGAFYVWRMNDLNTHFSDKQQNSFKLFFDTTENSYWHEADAHIFLFKDVRARPPLVDAHGIPSKNWLDVQGLLKSLQQHRTLPQCDTKQILAWNALVLKAYVKSYEISGLAHYLLKAHRLYNYITSNFKKSNTSWFHQIINQTPSGIANFEDLSYLISAFLDLSNCISEPILLQDCKNLTEQIEFEFKNPVSPLYFFGPEAHPTPFRTVETQDGVQPSANAVMAENFLRMGLILQNQSYVQKAQHMVSYMHSQIQSALPFYAYWAKVARYFYEPMVFLKIVGKSVDEIWNQLSGRYRNNCVLWVFTDDTCSQISATTCSLTACDAPDVNFNATLKRLERLQTFGSKSN